MLTICCCPHLYLAFIALMSVCDSFLRMWTVVRMSLVVLALMRLTICDLFDFELFRSRAFQVLFVLSLLRFRRVPIF